MKRVTFKTAHDVTIHLHESNPHIVGTKHYWADGNVDNPRPVLVVEVKLEPLYSFLYGRRILSKLEEELNTRTPVDSNRVKLVSVRNISNPTNVITMNH